ncbi:hypothetical protein FACS1894111_05850 [Clostridia bacterium]|nr:hypothetical protein FACS1894111_05850 [Clostridia bacterium]
MEREQAKKILIFCRSIEGEMSYNRKRLREYEEAYYTRSGRGGIDGMPKSKYKTSSPTEITAMNIPDSASGKMRDLRIRIEQLADLKAEIMKELDRLTLTQKSILHDFYILGMQWVQISERIHYSGTQCKKIRNRAIDNLAKSFDKNGYIKNFNYPN